MFKRFKEKLIFILPAIILLVVLPAASVSAQSELDFQIIKVSLDGSVGLDFQTPQSRLDYFAADLRIFPKDSYREDILEFNLKHRPSASVIMNNSIEYNWDDDVDEVSFGYDAKVKVWNRIFQIPADIPLSSLTLAKEHIKYVKETELVDIDNEIREKAFEITEGSSTLYETVFRLA